MLEELRGYDRGVSGLPEEVVIALAGPHEAAVFMATVQGLRAGAG